MYTRKRHMRLLLQRHGIQMGGAAGCNNGIISANGYRYKYNCEEYDEDTWIFSGGNGRPCFLLEILPSERAANLMSLERDPKCSMNIGATTKSAGKAAFALAVERGVKTITLTDNASKPMRPGDTAKFVVSDMEFLSYGKSWYETFLPVVPVDSHIIERWRNTVRTNSWTAVYTCLKQHHPDVEIPVSLENVDVDSPGSAMEIFRRIKDARTDFFVKYRWSLPLCSGIQSLYGTNWIAQVR
jgi:hypothetical protein